MTFNSDTCQVAEFFFPNHEMDFPLYITNREDVYLGIMNVFIIDCFQVKFSIRLSIIHIYQLTFNSMISRYVRLRCNSHFLGNDIRN